MRARWLAQNSTSLLITALVTTSRNESALQCWQLSQPFQASSTAGTTGALTLGLGGISNYTYSILPPRFDGGLHNAPAIQYVILSYSLELPGCRRPESGKWTSFILTSIKQCRLVHFVTGVAHITLPQNKTSEAWFLGGRSGLLIAADTVGGGHRTTYPSDESTVAIVAPFANGKAPAHTVLSEGPCVRNDPLL